MVLIFIQRVYAIFFAKKFFYKFNKLLYSLSLRGLGILNYESDKISGEECFIKKYVSKIENGVILDVGANIGNYSRKIRAVNPKTPIYAFEPHPKTFLKLQENLKELDVTIFNMGVGSGEGVLKLYDYADNDGSSHASLYKDVIEVIHKSKVTEHEVDVVALDDFSTVNNIVRVDLLKIDTEGHELEVLKGFEQYIKSGKVHLIHFEFNEMNVASRVFFKDLWDFLPNYDFYRMLPNSLIPIKNYNPVFCEIFAYQNIVAKLKKTSSNLNIE
jgi:FkbM family methyltransferase